MQTKRCPKFVFCLAVLAGQMTVSSSLQPANAEDKAEKSEVISPSEARTLEEIVEATNRELEEKYSVLKPDLLTKSHLKEAIEQAAEELANSEDVHRHILVESLQSILSAGELPEGVTYHLLCFNNGYKEGTQYYGSRGVSLNFTLSISTGPRHSQMVGLTDLVQTYRITPTGDTKSSSDKAAEDKPTKAEHDGTPSELVKPGNWLNLFFSGTEKTHPLRRGAIRAVKIVVVSEERPNWVKITFPKSKEDHASIFGPAAKAHDNDKVALEDALKEWEQGIDEWKTVWINLDYVVYFSPVGK